MIYNAENPEEYLKLLEPDWRRDWLLELRAMLLSHDQLQEGMEYKMLAYGNATGSLFHLNAQKGYVSLYVGDSVKIDPQGELLAGLDIGKGCIRFRKSNIPYKTRIGEFIARAVALWREGAELGC